jgi:predicted transcriptional regulator
MRANAPRTDMMSFQIDASLRSRLTEFTETTGDSASEVIRTALDEYLRRFERSAHSSGGYQH